MEMLLAADYFVFDFSPFNKDEINLDDFFCFFADINISSGLSGLLQCRLNVGQTKFTLDFIEKRKKNPEI
jgi:hypothetical protein